MDLNESGVFTDDMIKERVRFCIGDKYDFLTRGECGSYHSRDNSFPLAKMNHFNDEDCFDYEVKVTRDEPDYRMIAVNVDFWGVAELRGTTARVATSAARDWFAESLSRWKYCIMTPTERVFSVMAAEFFGDANGEPVFLYHDGSATMMRVRTLVEKEPEVA